MLCRNLQRQSCEQDCPSLLNLTSAAQTETRQIAVFIGQLSLERLRLGIQMNPVPGEFSNELDAPQKHPARPTKTSACDSLATCHSHVRLVDYQLPTAELWCHHYKYQKARKLPMPQWHSMTHWNFSSGVLAGCYAAGGDFCRLLKVEPLQNQELPLAALTKFNFLMRFDLTAWPPKRALSSGPRNSIIWDALRLTFAVKRLLKVQQGKTETTIPKKQPPHRRYLVFQIFSKFAVLTAWQQSAPQVDESM